MKKTYTDPKSLVQDLLDTASTQDVLIVGVSGLGGSGKTTLCKSLRDLAPDQVFHFECDLFAKYGTIERKNRIEDALASADLDKIKQEENPKNWYAWDDILSTLNSIKNQGSYTFCKGWNQKTGKKDKEVNFILPKHNHPIILVDCIYLLHEPIRQWFDISIFVSTPLNVTFERGKQRDRHRSDPQYLEYKQNLTKKYDVPYFKKYKSQADFIFEYIDNTVYVKASIREATKTDVFDLSELAAQTYKETFGHSFTPEKLEKQIQETRSEQYFLSALQKNTILVAEENSQIIGYVQICDMKITVKEHSFNEGDQAINAIYITADHQGKGIGKQLMDEAFKHPRIKQAKSVYIDVWEENERAVNFYINYGFSIIGKCDVIVDGKCIGEDLVLIQHTEKN